jgi:hypothetical protein
MGQGDAGKKRGDEGGAGGGNQGSLTFWSNQATGIVDDDVFELKLQPGNWGEMRFEE